MIYSSIIALVSSKTPVTNLIGTSPMRLFPILLPQGNSDWPAMTMRTVDNIGNPSFDGASELDHFHVDFWAFAQTIDDVDNLINTFRDELEDTSGTFNSVSIQNVRYVNSGEDDYLEDLDKKTRQIEFRISYLT